MLIKNKDKKGYDLLELLLIHIFNIFLVNYVLVIQIRFYVGGQEYGLDTGYKSKFGQGINPHLPHIRYHQLGIIGL